MGPILRCGHQRGSCIVSQCRYDFRRQSSNQVGSFFLAEISRTMSSFKPGGTVSESTSETKPYLYSRLASSSIVLVAVVISSFPEQKTSCVSVSSEPPSLTAASWRAARKPHGPGGSGANQLSAVHSGANPPASPDRACDGSSLREFARDLAACSHCDGRTCRPSPCRRGADSIPDRKSTRLNSS